MLVYHQVAGQSFFYYTLFLRTVLTMLIYHPVRLYYHELLPPSPTCPLNCVCFPLFCMPLCQ